MCLAVRYLSVIERTSTGAGYICTNPSSRRHHLSQEDLGLIDFVHVHVHVPAHAHAHHDSYDSAARTNLPNTTSHQLSHSNNASLIKSHFAYPAAPTPSPARGYCQTPGNSAYREMTMVEPTPAGIFVSRRSSWWCFRGRMRMPCGSPRGYYRTLHRRREMLEQAGICASTRCCRTRIQMPCCSSAEERRGLRRR